MDRKGITLLIFVLILFAMYLPLDLAHDNLYHFKTFVDDYIILNTKFIVIYISYAFYLLITLFYFLKVGQKKIINVILLSLVFAILIAYFIYIFFQNDVIRPVIIPKDFFDQLYVWTNQYVPPYNAFPSLHVAISTICLIGYIKLKSKLMPYMAVWVFLICLSTVYTKQHYFLDVIGGLILGISSVFTAERLIDKLK